MSHLTILILRQSNHTFKKNWKNSQFKIQECRDGLMITLIFIIHESQSITLTSCKSKYEIRLIENLTTKNFKEIYKIKQNKE